MHRGDGVCLDGRTVRHGFSDGVTDLDLLDRFARAIRQQHRSLPSETMGDGGAGGSGFSFGLGCGAAALAASSEVLIPAAASASIIRAALRVFSAAAKTVTLIDLALSTI